MSYLFRMITMAMAIDLFSDQKFMNHGDVVWVDMLTTHQIQSFETLQQ